MLNIRTKHIGELLKEKQDVWTCVVKGHVYTECITTSGRDLRITPFVKKWHRLRCLLDRITEVLDIRTTFLGQNFNTKLEVVVQNLQSCVATLESTCRVTEHSEAETKAAVSFMMPFILPTLMSNKTAFSLQKQRGKQGIMKTMLGGKWQKYRDEIDSFQLKVASILFAMGCFCESLNALRSIPGGIKFSFCSCYRKAFIYENPLIFVGNLPDLESNCTAKDILGKVVSPCVPFLPTEMTVIPRVIMYDCSRSICKPEKLVKVNVHQNHQVENQHNEPRREKTGFLHMRKQRRRSASR